MKTLINYSPNPFTTLLNDVFAPSFLHTEYAGNSILPDANILENDTDFQVQLAVPGFKKEEIQVEVKNNYLHVIGKQTVAEAKQSTSKFIRKEFTQNDFKRTFKLSEKVDATAINASLELGLLSISIKKAVEQTPVAIEIAVK